MNKYTTHILLGVFCLIFGYFISTLNSNNKVQKRFEQAQSFEAKKNEQVDLLETRITELSELNQVLNFQIKIDSTERRVERSKPITETTTINNERTILTRGIVIYGGNMRQDNTKRSLVASYGAQSIEEVEILRRVVENQKVQLENCKGVVLIKTEIITEYKEGLRYAAKKCRNGSLVKGVGIGVIGTVIFALLLL